MGGWSAFSGLIHEPGGSYQDSNPRPSDYQARLSQDLYPLDHGAVPDLEDHFMVYIMLMTAEKATKLGHDHVTRLEACFAVVLLIFNNLSAVFFT